MLLLILIQTELVCQNKNIKPNYNQREQLQSKRTHTLSLKLGVFRYSSPHYSREFKALVSGVSSPLFYIGDYSFFMFCF